MAQKGVSHMPDRAEKWEPFRQHIITIPCMKWLGFNDLGGVAILYTVVFIMLNTCKSVLF